ncbi:hypothetical protein LCGC14_2827890, partial [marine sediment metagenome]
GWLTAAAFTTAEIAPAMEMGMFADVDLLGLNRDEAAAVAGVDASGDVESLIRQAGRVLADLQPDIRLCVTAGAEGAFGWTAGDIEYTPAPPVEPVNSAGAGDAVLAGLIVGLAAGLPFILPDRPRRAALADAPLATAMDLAALLAGLAVTSEDTINFDADADVDLLGDAEGDGGGHLLDDHFLLVGDGLLGDFEEQFVVDLEEHAGGAGLFGDTCGDVDHGLLDEVGRRTLHDGIDRQPLGRGATLGIRRVDLRNPSPPPENGLDVAVGFSLRHARLEKIVDLRKPGSILLDEGVGLGAGNPKRPGQPEPRLPVNDTEVHRLGPVALLGGDLIERNAEHLGRYDPVNVLIGGEGAQERLVTAEMTQHAEFHLRIVRGEQTPSLLRDEGGPYLPPLLRANRDI